MLALPARDTLAARTTRGRANRSPPCIIIPVRRFARCVFALCWAVSLALCVATIVLWARSLRLNERYFLSYVLNRSMHLETADGMLHVRYRPAFGPPVDGRRPLRWGQWDQPATHSPLKTSFSLPAWRWGPFAYAARTWPVDPKTRARVRDAQLILDERARELARTADAPAATRPMSQRELARANISRLRLNFAMRTSNEYGAARELLFPAWSAASAFALGPMVFAAAWLRRGLLRQRRARRCLCTACGYDLRASPDRCPECGAPAAK
jgi:hypothetical protein